MAIRNVPRLLNGNIKVTTVMSAVSSVRLLRDVACGDQYWGTRRCALRTAAGYQGSTWEHVRSTEVKAYRPLRALFRRSRGLILAVRCPKWGRNTMASYRATYEGERERERWPRCTGCRDLRGPTAWTRRGYFWRGFKCLDATSNPERKKWESINTLLL